ncbi:MAG: Type secretion system domain protein [Mycobacterium sp.]|nr:Type secretion system domain protein [Mycobacterium sp.]
MGLFVGLMLGIGLFLCLISGRAPASRRPGIALRASALLEEAGVASLRPLHILALTTGAGILAAAVVLGLSSTKSVALVFGLFGASIPWVLLRRRVLQRQKERRELWPYVIDDLGSGIRAGLSLPEAVAGVAERGPEPLRPAFATFASEYRLSGSFATSLARLGDELADPVADRVIEALLLARDVGGTDVGRLMRGLGQALREDARSRGEIEAKQTWTVNGARLAVAAPWVVLLLLATHGGSIRVYDKPGGMVVLGVGAALSVLAYALMRRIGRLPSERRAVSVAP